MENLHDKRKSYEKFELIENQLENSPMKQFQNWYSVAEELKGEMEANAMSVSTLENDGCPRTRMVLLKSFDNNGFIFFTNYESRKGHSLEHYPKACLHFFWPFLERQVIIKAVLEKVSAEVSDDYFSSRPIGSQLGALASPQSRVIPNREFLEKKLKDLEVEFDGKTVQRPENWGGYLAKPYEIEFWQGRANRLHDRILYQLDQEDHWLISRLAP